MKNLTLTQNDLFVLKAVRIFLPPDHVSLKRIDRFVELLGSGKSVSGFDNILLDPVLYGLRDMVKVIKVSGGIDAMATKLMGKLLLYQDELNKKP